MQLAPNTSSHCTYCFIPLVSAMKQHTVSATITPVALFVVAVFVQASKNCIEHAVQHAQQHADARSNVAPSFSHNAAYVWRLPPDHQYHAVSTAPDVSVGSLLTCARLMLYSIYICGGIYIHRALWVLTATVVHHYSNPAAMSTPASTQGRCSLKT
jgi:hypothetical protein